MAKCGARTKAADAHPCELEGTGAGGRCYFHGGSTPVGQASPNWKHGRHSKHLPPLLRARAEEAYNDPKITSMRSELALTDARIQQLIEGLGTGETYVAWFRIKDSARRVRAAAAAEDLIAARAAMDELLTAIDNGVSAEEAWTQIHDAIERRRRLAETERRRMVELKQTITAERAYTLVQQLIAIVKENVPDPDARTRIAARLASLVNRPEDTERPS